MFYMKKVMNHISIRKLKSNESLVYREIRLECLKLFPENFGSNYDDETLKPKLFFQPYIENFSQDNFVIGAFHKTRLIGISGFNRYDSQNKSHNGRIIQVYIKPEFQGQKLGKHIVIATLVEAFKISEIQHIEIGVMSTNHIAKAIYLSIGFEVIDIEKNYVKYSNTYADNIIMSMSRQTYLNLDIH